MAGKITEHTATATNGVHTPFLCDAWCASTAPRAAVQVAHPHPQGRGEAPPAGLRGARGVPRRLGISRRPGLELDTLA